MASYSIGLNKLISSNLHSKSLFRPVKIHYAAAPTVRSFEDDENDEITILRARDRFGLSVPHRCVMFVPYTANQTHFITSSHGRSRPTCRVPYFARETDEALHIGFRMPGLSEEDVNVTLPENTLVIIGEAKKGFNEEFEKFESKLDLTEKFFKIEDVNTEMKNGVLNLTVP